MSPTRKAGRLADGLFKRRQRGLYGGKRIQFGNKISEKGKNKSRRKWVPNVQWKRLYSEALDRMVRMRVTTSVLKTVDMYGGLDNYLTKTSPEKLDSQAGLALRARILAAMARGAGGRAGVGDHVKRRDAEMEKIVLTRDSS